MFALLNDLFRFANGSIPNRWPPVSFPNDNHTSTSTQKNRHFEGVYISLPRVLMRKRISESRGSSERSSWLSEAGGRTNARPGRVRTSERAGERTKGRSNGRMNGRADDQTAGTMDERTSQRTSERTGEWTDLLTDGRSSGRRASLRAVASFKALLHFILDYTVCCSKRNRFICLSSVF